MEDKKILNKKYVYFYALALLINAITTGHHISFSGNFALMFVDGTIVPFPFIPGAVVGSILTGIFPKIGKRTKLILANLLVIVYAPLYTLNERWNYSRWGDIFGVVSLLLYGMGAGIASVATPLYLKDLAPREMLHGLYALYVAFFSVGISSSTVVRFFFKVSKHVGSAADAILVHRIISTSLAFIQLVLLLAIFRRDTPRHLYQANLQDKAMEELVKIYPSTSRRISVFFKIESTAAEYKLEYPTYRKLFSKEYFGLLVKASLVLLLRAPFISPSLNPFVISQGPYPSYFVAAFIAYAAVTLGNLLPFFLPAEFLRKKVALAGSALVSVLLAFVIALSWYVAKNRDDSYIIVMAIRGFIETLVLFFHSALISVAFFVYAITIMTERGFTLAIILYWFATFAIEGLFGLYAVSMVDTIDVFFSYYFIVSFVAAVVCIVASWLFIPRSLVSS